MRTADTSGIGQPRLCSLLQNWAVRMGCLKQRWWLEEGGWRRTEHDPLLPASRLGLSPSAWARDAQSLSSYCLYCSLAGLASWLAERRKRRWGIMTTASTNCRTCRLSSPHLAWTCCKAPCSSRGSLLLTLNTHLCLLHSARLCSAILEALTLVLFSTGRT